MTWNGMNGTTTARRHDDIRHREHRDTEFHRGFFELINLVRKYFEVYYHLYYSFDRKTAIELGKKDIELYEANYNMRDKVKGESRSMKVEGMNLHEKKR